MLWIVQIAQIGARPHSSPPRGPIRHGWVLGLGHALRGDLEVVEFIVQLHIVIDCLGSVLYSGFSKVLMYRVILKRGLFRRLPKFVVISGYNVSVGEVAINGRKSYMSGLR